MFVLITGVLNVLPDAKGVPPAETSYQLITPDGAVAFKDAEPAEHREAPVVTGALKVVLTVIEFEAFTDWQEVITSTV